MLFNQDFKLLVLMPTQTSVFYGEVTFVPVPVKRSNNVQRLVGYSSHSPPALPSSCSRLVHAEGQLRPHCSGSLKYSENNGYRL